MRFPRFAMVGASALFCAAATAQPPTPLQTWQVVHDDRHRGEIKSMVIASNGDIIVSGFMPSRRGNSDAWIARYDQACHELWSQLVGGSGRDEALGLALAPDGGIVVIGWRDIGSTSASSSNGLVAKLGPDGAVMWDVTLRAASQLALNDVAILENGDVIVAGRGGFYSGDQQSDVYAARLDDAGSVKWALDPTSEKADAPHIRSFTPIQTAISLISPDVIELQRVSGRWIAGCVAISAETGATATSACDRKTPSSVKRASGATTYIAGTTGPYDATDAFIQKFEGGSLVWERTLLSPDIDGVHTFAATTDGGVILAGYSIVGDDVKMHNWDALLIRLDGDGKEVWRRKFGGGRRDEFTSVAVLRDGSIIAAGYTGSQGEYEWNPWLLRLNASGELGDEARRDLEQKQK